MMNWSRENPRYRRSPALVRRQKKKGFFSRLDSWLRGRKISSKSETEAESKHHRPEPTIPPLLLEELKIAVPRPKAPKPKPAPRVCPPPEPKAAAAAGPRKGRRAQAKTHQAGRAGPPFGTEKDSGTLSQAPVSPTLDELDDDFFVNTRQARKTPAAVLEPGEAVTELVSPEPPADDGSLADDGATVVPVAFTLDRSEVKTVPASIYQNPVSEPEPVRLAGPDGDDVPEEPPETAAPEAGSVPVLEGAPEDNETSLFERPSVSVEPGSATEPGGQAGDACPTPRPAVSRREVTVDYTTLRSSSKRWKSRVGAALDRSSFLRWGLVAGLAGLLAVGIGLGWSYFNRPATPTAKVARIPAANLPKVRPLAAGFFEQYAREQESAFQTKATIAAGSGLGQALEAVGLGGPQRSAAIIDRLTKDGGVNPTSVRAGATLTAYWSSPDRGELKRLEYRPETGGAPLVLMPRDDGAFWLYNMASPRLTLSAAREGVVESSLWQAGSEVGLDASAIMGLSDILASDVDFFNDIKKGDSFQVLYSREYQDGQPKGAPVIDMVKLVNKGREYEYYRFVGPDDKVSYYDAEGRTSHKTFFVTPLQYKRISSGFTMKRLHPIHRVVRPHQGVDYAAPSGTPVSAVADGTVVFAGWNGGYGRLITIKHDETYTTMYAHLSRFAPGIKKGGKVRQGDLIGHVGATGTATGPHLDFRLKKNGNFIDPVPELAKQQGRKLESGDFIDLTKVIGLMRQRMTEQLAANRSGA